MHGNQKRFFIFFPYFLPDVPYAHTVCFRQSKWYPGTFLQPPKSAQRQMHISTQRKGCLSDVLAIKRSAQNTHSLPYFFDTSSPR